MTERFYAWNPSQNESCFGLLTVHRRRFIACSVQPVGPVQHVSA
jgi:hypothetical protein